MRRVSTTSNWLFHSASQSIKLIQFFVHKSRWLIYYISCSDLRRQYRTRSGGTGAQRDRAVMDRQRVEAEVIMVEQQNVKQAGRYNLWTDQNVGSLNWDTSQLPETPLLEQLTYFTFQAWCMALATPQTNSQCTWTTQIHWLTLAQIYASVRNMQGQRAKQGKMHK